MIAKKLKTNITNKGLIAPYTAGEGIEISKSLVISTTSPQGAVVTPEQISKWDGYDQQIKGKASLAQENTFTQINNFENVVNFSGEVLFEAQVGFDGQRLENIGTATDEKDAVNLSLLNQKSTQLAKEVETQLKTLGSQVKDNYLNKKITEKQSINSNIEFLKGLTVLDGQKIYVPSGTENDQAANIITVKNLIKAHHTVTQVFNQTWNDDGNASEKSWDLDLNLVRNKVFQVTGRDGNIDIHSSNLSLDPLVRHDMNTLEMVLGNGTFIYNLAFDNNRFIVKKTKLGIKGGWITPFDNNFEREGQLTINVLHK